MLEEETQSGMPTVCTSRARFAAAGSPRVRLPLLPPPLPLQLPSLTGWVADMGMNPSLRPAAVLQLSEVPPGVGSSRVLAFHGTR